MIRHPTNALITWKLSRTADCDTTAPSTPVTSPAGAPGGPFKSFRVTPGGTIVSLMGRLLKPETDPDWEETKTALDAAHRAKRQRGSPDSQ